MLKRRTDWFPANREDQSAMFSNIRAKIGGYKNILNLTNGQIERIATICHTFISINNYVEQTHITAKNTEDWQNLILTGSPKGAIPPPAPIFQSLIMPEGAFIGVFEEFWELIEIIKSAKYYTQSVGADLMILESNNRESDENRVFPTLKVQCMLGGKIHLEGNLKGMPAMRVEYRHKFSEQWQTVAFLTQLPAQFAIKLNKDEPKIGQLRAILMKSNNEVGQFSLNYPISLS